jgi:hypothetical protein
VASSKCRSFHLFLLAIASTGGRRGLRRSVLVWLAVAALPMTIGAP